MVNILMVLLLKEALKTASLAPGGVGVHIVPRLIRSGKALLGWVIDINVGLSFRAK